MKEKTKKTLILLFAFALVLCLASPARAYDIKTGNAAAIAASQTHAAYIDSGGGLWTWGRNACGELGSGSRDNSSVPVKALDGAASVSLGDGVSAAIKTDGSLWMWGSNYHGQLGTNGTGDIDIGGTGWDHASKHYIHTSPVKVMDNVAYVRAGSFYTAAIKTDGTLWMWGDNQYGHIGNGGEGNVTDRHSFVYQTVPVKIMDNVASVTFNEDAHVVAAIKTDGTLWMWGRNAYGELGNGGKWDKFYEYPEINTIEGYQTTPVKILDGVASVSIGANHTAAIKTDGTLWMWGSNFYGQLGNGSTEESESNVPIKIMDNVAAVDLGWSRTSALKTDGTLWTWGWNFYGRLGNGSTEDSSVPVKIMEQVAAVGGARDYAAAVKTDGSLWTWGWNYYGQLGNGSTENSSVPVKAADNIAAVSGSQGFMMAVKTDGSLWSWGWNDWGQLGNGTTENAASPAKIQTAAAPGQSQPTDVSPVSPFKDVDPNDYYYEPVLWAVENGITNGVTAGTFAPGAVCTRGEIITFLWRAMGKPESGMASSTFTDISESDFYYKPVLWACEQGMASGDLFSPKDPCTRAQTVEFMWAAAGRPEVEAETGFTDVVPASSYSPAVSWAVSSGIVTGTSPTTFSPEDTCTRGQIVTLLWRDLAEAE